LERDTVQPRRAVLLLVCLLVMWVGSPSALETDQYWAWGRPLADSTDAVNAKFTLELERTIAGFPADRQPKSCRQIVVAYRKRMRSLLLHEIQVWAWNSEWVARIPDGGDEQREYRRTNLYSRHPLIDPGTWMPYTPTIEIAGVRMGTDKVSHFVSSGWTYFREYERGLADGQTPAEAERRAVRRGLLEESLVLGGMTSGVQAIADLEASYGGMHFYRDLCGGDDPVLRLVDGRWIVSRPIDLADYVTPRWDESYQPPVYSKSRWRRVRPVLEGYCDRLDDPQVVAMRRAYRDRDRGSVVDEIVAERVAAGKLEDPARFGIEAVCAEPDPSHLAGETVEHIEVTGANAAGVRLKERLVEEDENRCRYTLGLAGVQLTYPQVISASLAVMFASQPASYDCRTPCDFRGPFIQIEPGLNGGKLSVGWGRVTGETNRPGSFLAAAFIGLAYKATVFHSWSDTGPVAPGRTYAGLEVGLPVARANLGLGLLYRVDGGDAGRWLVTGGAGWGF